MVNIALIGLGQRGLATLRRYLRIKDARITVVCDLRSDALDEARTLLPPGVIFDTDWHTAINRPEADTVFVCTDWRSHTEISVAALLCGKDVASEVPAAVSIADGMRLIETVKSTGRRFTMMENCCFDPFALSTLVMARSGALGDILHCEGAYIHDLRKLYAGKWYGRESSLCTGNPYPTHGIGPICQLLDVGRSDRLTELVSMTTSRGGINSSLIRTERGRTILLQYDVNTPRPYSRLQTVCGTAGYVSKYPVETVQIDGHEPLHGKDLEEFLRDYRHPWLDKYEADAIALGVDNMMNYIMDRRLTDCLNGGLQPDITVTDAVLWSAISELTHISASQGSRPVEIPDFSI